MEGFVYYAALAVIAILAFTLYQNNSTKLALLVLLVGVYVIYSHETGYTATNFKNDMVDNLKEDAEGFSKSYGLEGFDEMKGHENMK